MRSTERYAFRACSPGMQEGGNMEGVVVTEALGDADRAFFDSNSYLRLSGVFGPRNSPP